MKANVSMSAYYAEVEALAVRSYAIEYTERIEVCSTRGWGFEEWNDFDPYEFQDHAGTFVGDADALADFVKGITESKWVASMSVNGKVVFETEDTADRFGRDHMHKRKGVKGL